MRSKLLLVLTIGLTGVVLVTACGGDDDAPMATPKDEKPATGGMAEGTPEAMGKAAPADERPVKVVDIAEQLRVEIEIPSYYPEDGPIYPGAKPSQAQQAANGRVSMVFGTDEMPAEASTVMNQAAEDLGWTILSEDQMERGLLTQAEKDGRKMMILTTRMEGGESSEPVTLVAVSVDP